MAKKPRSQRRKKGGAAESSSKSLPVDDAEYLSESHTIVSESGTIFSTSSDDGGWNIDDDDYENDIDDTVGATEGRQQKLVDSLSECEEFSYEKRSAKRETTLRQWFKAITQYVDGGYDIIESKLTDIVRGCQYSLRNGSPSEQYAACRVLQSAAIVMGDEDYFEQIYDPILLKVLQSTHRAIPVRIAALRAVGMAVFIGVDDDQVTESILDLCEALSQNEFRGNKVPSALRAAALDVWNLLATTLHELYIAGKDDFSTGRGLLLLPVLLECLEQQEDLALQSAAGECVAWIHTARLQLGEEQFKLGSWEGSEWEDTIAEIEQCMDMLSNQSGHYISKKKKKETRYVFRELLATIQDNEPPLQVLQFRGGSLEFNSWRDIIALNFMRRSLQGGFQIQLMTNPTLQAIFGANGQTLNAAGGYSQLEKRLLLSKASEAVKVKDLNRTKQRKKKQNVKNLFLTSDD